jgi:chaperone LolA
MKFMKITHWLLSLTLLVISTSIFADEQGDAQVRLSKALKALDSIQVNFEQTVLNDNSEVIQQSTGSLAIQRPQKFNWTYKTPNEQQIIADGEEIWVYDVDLKQATVKPMNDSLSNTPIMILMNSNILESKFNLNEIGQKKFLYWVELTPKNEEAQFERIYFGLKDKQIMAMDLRDTFGQSTQIVFSEHRYNVIHNPATFMFEATPDIDVYGGQ